MARKLLEALPGLAAQSAGGLGEGLVQPEFYLTPHIPERTPPGGRDRREGAMGPQVLIAGGGRRSWEDCSLGVHARLCLWARPVLFQGQMVRPITLLLGAGSFALSPREGQ